MADVQSSFFDDPIDLKPSALSARDRELVTNMPDGLKLGTSSWHFPGWQDLVWQDQVPQRTLARYGLTAYAAQGLFKTVSIDRTFYAPVDAQTYKRYAEQVGDGFRFVAKAWSKITEPRIDGRRNQAFLQADVAEQAVLAPAVRGLGTKLGLLHLQFSPRASALFARHLSLFVKRLEAFFQQLSEGPRWSVEFRDQNLYCDDVLRVLEAHRAVPCLSVHPSVPSTARLIAAIGAQWPTLSVRWNLKPSLSYAQAKTRYSPFNRLVAPDPDTRNLLARVAARYGDAGKDVYIIANNKAEASAPLTLRALAQAMRLIGSDQAKRQ